MAKDAARGSVRLLPRSDELGGRSLCFDGGDHDLEGLVLKPRVRLRPQFQIPKPFRVWCHIYSVGLMSIEESQQHDREKLREHQAILARKDEQKK
jgi:hypothetical protein